MTSARLLDLLDSATAPIRCRLRGHMWDSDRPAGPIHARDICWRCGSVYPDREEPRWVTDERFAVTHAPEEAS